MRSVVCLVLGANGFIGTNLTQALLSAGANVKGFGRQKPSLPNQNLPWIQGDFNDKQALASAVKGCEVVYHLISDSIPASLNIDQPDILMSDLYNTLNLLDVCKLEGVRKVVFVSSGGTVYGVSNSTPIFESSATDPISSYGINKLSSEKYLNLYYHLYGLDYAVARVSNPYGPHQNIKKPQGIIATLICNAMNNKPTEIWGDGEIVRDYIYVEDVVDALIKITNYSGPAKVFNLGSGVGRSTNQIISDIGRIIGSEKIKVNYVDNSRLVDVPVNILNTDLLRSQTDWNAKTSLTQGLELTVDWFIKNQGSIS